jgi:phosphatidylglycerol:prolipoprotein diacylglycerol transferase
LPLHPLQLYFALAGLILFCVLAAYAPHKRYDGEITLLFVLGYLWSTWGLEFLRAEPHAFTQQVVLIAALITTAVMGGVELRRATRRDGRQRTSPTQHHARF